MKTKLKLSRRRFVTGCLAAASTIVSPRISLGRPTNAPFRLKYILASAMYGYTSVRDIVPEVKKAGADAIDIWPKVHGNQREQIDEMGLAAFVQLLNQYSVKLGGVTCYRLGPLNLQAEMRFAERIGGKGVVLVTGAHGPKDLQGSELKQAVRRFAEEMKPHMEVAEETGCIVAIENHANSLICSPDSIRWFGELSKSSQLGIALAPHHLPQDAELIAGLAEELGSNVKFFYAQQHGMGSQKKLPKEQEMLQMPGRGPLDFRPILAALRKINYQGYTEIFMHPVPRGVPILDSTAAITREINRSRRYLDNCLEPAQK